MLGQLQLAIKFYGFDNIISSKQLSKGLADQVFWYGILVNLYKVRRVGHHQA